MYILLVILFTNIFVLRHASTSMSGIYIDNGYDKTELQQELSPEDQLEVEHEILDLLGLPDRPRRKHAPSLRKSAPRFLLDIYEKLEEEANWRPRRPRSVDDEEIYLTPDDQRAIDQSDIIMTFLTKTNHVDEVRHEHGHRLWFDISETSIENNLVIAELRLYKNAVDSECTIANTSTEYRITVYSIGEFGGEEDLIIQSQANITSSYQGWLEFNVTNAMSRWLLHRDQNRGLYISVTNANRDDIKLENSGIVTSRLDDEHQPFMVAFFKAPQQLRIKKHTHSRQKRNAQRKRNKGKTDYKNPLLYTTPSSESHRSCQIQTMYVSFKELKWQDWIVAPDGYNAFYCAGECNFPLNAHMNATNHAIVQTLVHLMNPGRVPKPSCAPTRLSAISVLYYLDDSNVNLKKYKNMVVKSCGCH